MRPHLNAVTLGVDDLDRALTFYREGLGLATPGIVGTEWPEDERNAGGAVVMFELDDGFFLSLYPRSQLAKDAHMAQPPASPGGFSLGHFVASRDEVDATLAAAAAAGGHVTAPAHDRPWGIYSGYFQDPDGHLWEVLYSPPRGV
jgi:catechol 2,3-dioxygenase-like lactoylglutathione lyase family enzyme